MTRSTAARPRGPGRPRGRTTSDGVVADREALLVAAERLVRRDGPSVSLDADPLKLQIRPEQLPVKLAVGGSFSGLAGGMFTLRLNSDVLPFAFVAVAVTGLPSAPGTKKILTNPVPSAVADWR